MRFLSLQTNTLATEKSPFPLGFHLFNTLLMVVAFGFLAVYVSLSFVNEPPYDFAILMFGAEAICFQPQQFIFGEDGIHYPAVFYSTFCLPNHYIPEIFLSIWMLIPFVLTLWLAKGRAAVLAFPPLFILLLLGQSSGLLLPLYMVAVFYAENPKYPVKWWYGFVFVLGILKPHVALPAFFYLVYVWRKQWIAILVGAIASIALMIPSFILQPNWVGEWFENTRGFQPVSLANLAKLPVRFFNVEFSPGAGINLAVWGFCVGAMVILLALLYWRRGKIEFYDFALVFLFTFPAINDYDLIVLLPLVAYRPRRLLLVLVAGILTWLFTLMQLERRIALYPIEVDVVWNMSIYCTLALLADRFIRLRDGKLDKPMIGIPPVPEIFIKDEKLKKSPTP